jgi:hypothetical protein
MVAYFCNPSYSAGRDQQNNGSRLARPNKLDVVVCAYNPSYKGGISRRISVQARQGKKKHETLSEK